MTRALTTVIFVALFVSTASALWPQVGKPPERSPDRKQAGSFGAHLLTVSKPNEFIQMWISTPPGHSPKIPLVESTSRDEPVGIIVLFAGCAENSERRCNAKVDFVVYRPDGLVYTSQKDQDLWIAEAPPKGNVQLGRAILTIDFRDNDPSGEYRIVANVRDLNANVGFDLERTITVR